MRDNNRLLYLDGLRAIAAIYVVMHHAMLEVYVSHKELSLVDRATILGFNFGHYSVDVFIVLSGFCLMIPTLNHNYQLKGGIIYFFKRRVIRILPPYYFAMTISLILIWTLIGKPTGGHWDASIPVDFNAIITHIFMINDLFGSTVNKINHTFWSIAVEFRIYLLFPIILFLWRKFGFLASAVACLLTCVGITVFLYHFSKIYPDLNFATGVCPYILLFLFGAAAAKLSLSPGKYSSFVKKTPWFLLFMVLLVTLVLIDRHINALGVIAFHMQNIGVGLCAFCLLLSCINFKPINNILSYRPFVFLGSFSFSIYLLHAPLLAIVYQYFIKPMGLSITVSAFLLITLGTAFSVVVAYLFFLLFEKPFINMGKKATQRQTEINAIVNPAP